FGSIVIGIVVMLAIYMGLIVTGVIDTRPSTLVIAVDSAQKEFDGTPLTCEKYEIKKGALKKGHKIEVTYGAYQTEVGWVENAATVKIKDALGADVTSHYTLEVRPGKLTVTPCKLIVKSGDTQKVYDGTPLTYEMWDVVIGTLPQGYTTNATFTGAQVVPGASDNTFVLMIYDERGNAVNRSFDINYIYGKLTVTKRPITVTSYGATKVYDGEPLRYESYTLDGELLPEHFLDVSFPESITNVGSVTNNIGVRVQNMYGDGSMGGDATDFYEISVRVGKLEVTPRPIEVSASPCIKHFSGDVLPQGTYFLTKGSLVAGHELSAEVEAIKNYEDTVEFMLRDVQIFDVQDAGGDAVTHNYEITLVHGIDRDHLEKLTFASADKSAPYTGEPLTCEQFVLAEGVLDALHEVVPHFTGSQTEIGFSDNTFTVTIVDTATGEDVTYRYDITYEYGTLEVYENAPSTGGEISDDGSLDNSTQNADAVAARVWATSGGRVYLRWKSYGDYSFRQSAGNWGWGDAMAYPLASENMLYTVGQILAQNGVLPIDYQIEILGSQFLLPNYVAKGPEGALSDVMLSPYTDSYMLSGYSWNYSYADALRYAATGLEDEQNKAYTAFVYGQYLSVPESTKQALLAFAEQNGLAVDRLSIIEDVASAIRSSATYDLAYPVCPEDKDEVVFFLTESHRGVCRHFASAATLLYRSLGIPARYVVGYSTYAAGDAWTDVKGADAHAWVEVFITGLGWVRIDPTPAQSSVDDDALVLMPIKIMGYYTGLPYIATPESVMIVQGSLKPGHSLQNVQVSGQRTEAGESISVITGAQIVDENGADVTGEYKIVFRDGVIEVRKPTLVITAASAKKVYDGMPLENLSFTHTFKNAQFANTYQVTATVNGQQTEVGQSENTIGDVVITDILGRDVTRNFDVQKLHGSLKVYMYELSVQSSGASKVYDGTPLSSPELIFDADALASRGHTLEYTMPSITSVGSIYNTPTCRVLDAQGNDVTAEYDLRISAGVLRVSAIRLTMVTDSAEKVYDGKALRAEHFTLSEGELAAGQSIVSYQIKGSQTNVGVSDATVTDIVIVDANGRNVTANYQITIIPGTLRVLAP
ncbi:MAG: transglutaminase domain-containing protein, partial [Clostridia bacterium]|nr:transglutaminase domain-containing protein [Clostridia bacterium]